MDVFSIDLTQFNICCTLAWQLNILFRVKMGRDGSNILICSFFAS